MLLIPTDYAVYEVKSSHWGRKRQNCVVGTTILSDVATATGVRGWPS